ncbi:hypothetical protein T552_01449 [Pneumocystis carinii B80]|uniref:Protein BCP1 n=1 Tax=Pneumocystis carinii (strain B80) TaxID=1408658 RepID=A0A0W4ZKC6_PNEC8|nr:hypothetical protein T552_01449 [Pneumocystis carinii B80]KTW28819.1 hypothetical protein T552_01449 [Pneumocystis carinii B80]
MEEKTRKKRENSSSIYETTSSSSDNDNSSSLQVDFEFFNPRLGDLYTLRTLLRQLIGPDSDSIDINGLSDLVICQTLVGSTVKMDGIEGDPLAFLSVLNMNYYCEKECIKRIKSYIMTKICSEKEFYDFFCTCFEGTGPNIGLILSERLINMPIQVVPAMYEMLFEEIQWAQDDKEPYNFEYYIIISRSSQERVDQKGLKKRRRMAESKKKTLYFHQEDEIFKEKSLYSVTYDYSQCKGLDDVSYDRNNEARHQGEIIMISKEKLKEAINELKTMIT